MPALRQSRGRCGEFPSQDSHGPTGVLINLLTEDHSQAPEGGAHHVLMDWYRVGGLDYLLERSEV